MGRCGKESALGGDVPVGGGGWDDLAWARDRDARVGDAVLGGSVARDVAENLRCLEIDQRSSSHSPMELHMCFRCNLRMFDADQGGRHVFYFKQYN